MLAMTRVVVAEVVRSIQIGYILKIELIIVTHRLDVNYEKKKIKSRIKYNFPVLGLKSWINKLAIKQMGNPRKESGLGWRKNQEFCLVHITFEFPSKH